MRVLVTGAAGFIGSHLVDRLVRRGDRVEGWDDLSSGALHNLARPLESRLFRFVRAGVGLASREDFAEAVARADAVVHLAAEVGVERVLRDPDGVCRRNAAADDAVVEAISRHPRRLLVASTSEVYGGDAAIPCRESAVRGRLPAGARWSYARTKSRLESRAGECRGALVVRFFNVVGPRQSPDGGMVLARFVAAALRGEPLEVHGSGLQSRSFADVRDVALDLERLLSSERASDLVVNVGRLQEWTVGDLASEVVRVTGSGSEIRFVPSQRWRRGGEDPVARRVPDLSRLRSLVGELETRPLRETIRDAANEPRFRPAPRSRAARGIAVRSAPLGR